MTTFNIDHLDQVSLKSLKNNHRYRKSRQCGFDETFSHSFPMSENQLEKKYVQPTTFIYSIYLTFTETVCCVF